MRLLLSVLTWLGWAIWLLSFFLGGHLLRNRPTSPAPEAGYLVEYTSHGDAVFVTQIESALVTYGFATGLLLGVLGIGLLSWLGQKRRSHA